MEAAHATTRAVLGPEVIAPILRELKVGLQAIYGARLRELILFGSYARGEAKPDSDIDVAVSGILDAQTFFRLCARAQDLSDFPVHIVQMETIGPSYAASIKKRGRLVHERPVR